MAEDTQAGLNVPSEVGGRFVVTADFVPSSYGDGYFNICVHDSLTGRELTGVVTDPGAVQTTAKQLAQRIVAMHDGSMKAPSTFRFDLPGTDREDDGSAPGTDAISGD